MAPKDKRREVAQTWDQMGEEQLKLYAQELAELYRKERQLRQEMEAKNRELEQKAQQLSALSSMFQEHLNLRFQTEDTFEKLLAGIRDIAQKANDLVRRAEDLAMPDRGEKTTGEPQPLANPPSTA